MKKRNDLVHATKLRLILATKVSGFIIIIIIIINGLFSKVIRNNGNKHQTTLMSAQPVVASPSCFYNSRFRNILLLFAVTVQEFSQVADWAVVKSTVIGVHWTILVLYLSSIYRFCGSLEPFLVLGVFFSFSCEF